MKRFFKELVRLLALVLAAGVAAGLLARYSPGALVDARELNQRLGEDSLAALRTNKERNRNTVRSLTLFFEGLAHGDLGYSESNDSPVRHLIADRAPSTWRELAIGLTGGWLIGLGCAIPVGRFRRAWLWDAGSSLLTGLVLSLPAALIAYFCLNAEASSGAVLIVVLAPRIFRFARNILVQAYDASHVQAARARGVPEWTILRSHVLTGAAPQFMALLASSASMAFGAAIPVEAICGTPGLGRLAWQAAVARDLPLLMSLTMMVAVATALAMSLSEMAGSRERQPEGVPA